MAQQFIIPNIPPSSDLDQLRLSVTNALSKLIGQLNQQAINSDLDVTGHRIINVGDPSGPYDAVNKRYIKKLVGDIELVGSSGGGGAYTIVFSAATVASGDTTPVFVVGSDRNGVAEEAWAYCVGTPTTTGGFIVQIARNGTNILGSNLIVGTGTTGPTFITTFTGATALNHGDRVSLVLTSAGNANNVSVGLVVRRS